MRKMATYWVKEITDPLSNNEHHDDGQTECNISCTLYKDHRQADGHPHRPTQLTGGTNQRIFPDVLPLQYTFELHV